MAKVAFLFPGQGSQALGMGGALAAAYPQAREVFERVDTSLGQTLYKLMQEGPEADLTLTANTQPALMAHSVAAARVLEAEAGKPLAELGHFAAGHSLGEYSALAALGALSLEDTARALRARGEAMQAAVPAGEGAMAAVLGMAFDALRQITEQAEAATGAPCDLANDNAEGQIVISGAKAAVEKAGELAQEAGAKRVVPLNVSAPFHSRLMQPAADTMARVLGETQIQAPSLPLVANVLAAPNQDAGQVADLLVRQVTGRVRWRETMAYFVEQGVDTYVELGSGKVLTGLAKRPARGATLLNLAEPADLDAVLAALI